MAALSRLWSALRWHLGGLLGPGDFAIRHRPGRPTEVRGRVPGAHKAAIAEFLASDLRPPGPLVVRGTFGPGGVPRLRVSGRLSHAQRQRLRNFLVAQLG